MGHCLFRPGFSPAGSMQWAVLEEVFVGHMSCLPLPHSLTAIVVLTMILMMMMMIKIIIMINMMLMMMMIINNDNNDDDDDNNTNNDNKNNNNNNKNNDKANLNKMVKPIHNITYIFYSAVPSCSSSTRLFTCMYMNQSHLQTYDPHAIN